MARTPLKEHPYVLSPRDEASRVRAGVSHGGFAPVHVNETVNVLDLVASVEKMGCPSLFSIGGKPGESFFPQVDGARV